MSFYSVEKKLYVSWPISRYEEFSLADSAFLWPIPNNHIVISSILIQMTINFGVFFFEIWHKTVSRISPPGTSTLTFKRATHTNFHSNNVTKQMFNLFNLSNEFAVPGDGIDYYRICSVVAFVDTGMLQLQPFSIWFQHIEQNSLKAEPG